MMKPTQISDELDAYMIGLLPARDPVLDRLERQAEAENIPIIGPHEGMLLSLLIRLSGARRILELGTATGYSGIWLLRGAVEGTLTTFELDPDRAQQARANFEEAGFGATASVIEADAAEALKALDGKFDACFIDLLNSFPSEAVTETVFHACLDCLEPGGLLIADNALRTGEVVRPASQQARNVARYNRLVAASSRLEGLVIPIRDGVSVARMVG